MASTYNREQTIFVLAVLSNLASAMTGPVDQLEDALAFAIDSQPSALAPRIGTWQRVWGPAVYQVPGSIRADNVAFAAANTATPRQIVISVAGTNPASAFDWLVEDAFVSAQVPWACGTPTPGSTPKIAAGTFIGLSILQHLAPGPGLPGSGQLLRTFLRGAMTQTTEVIVTGHSLGGAFSPALALWLFDTRPTWDPKRQATLFCQPSAGPTAGNIDFVSYYTQSLGARTTRLYNRIDVVPHAWNETDLSHIPTLYAPNIEPDATIDFLDLLARGAADSGGYTQINQATTPLPGTVNTSLINPNASPIDNFLVQAGYQHVDAYGVLLGLTEVQPLLQALRLAVTSGLRRAVERRKLMAAAAGT